MRISQIHVLQSWRSRGKLHVLVVAARPEQDELPYEAGTATMWP